MVQSAEYRAPTDHLERWGWARTRACLRPARLQAQRAVWPVAVVGAGVLCQNRAQVRLIQPRLL